MNRLLYIRREKCIMHLTKVLLPLFNLFKSAKCLTINALHSTIIQLTDNQRVTCFSIDKVFFINYLLLSNFGIMKLHRNTKTFLNLSEREKNLLSQLSSFLERGRGDVLLYTELIKININNNNNLN